MNHKQQVYISKKMSYALRHNPAKYGLELAADGSVELSRFLKAMNGMHHFDPPLTEAIIREVMAGADKQRFAVEDGRIRALYGHSIPGNVTHREAEPPSVLYHGTSRKAMESILRLGLLPMGRQYVHLSADVETARQVGARRDCRPVILTVDAARAAENGVRFYVGNDKVWRAAEIPPRYLSETSPGTKP